MGKIDFVCGTVCLLRITTVGPGLALFSPEWRSDSAFDLLHLRCGVWCWLLIYEIQMRTELFEDE